MYLRSYKPEDFEALFALDVTCFEAAFCFSRTMMRRVLNAPGACVNVACERDLADREALLGFSVANLLRDGRRTVAYLSTLDVAPAHQRRGIGRLLIQATENHLFCEGMEEVLLHVYVDNLAALRLYRSLGYREAGLERDYYGRGLDAWEYHKRLVLPEEPLG